MNNDTLDLEVDETAGCQVKFAVTMKSDAVKASLKKAIGEVKKKVSIPGFRKGKVPDATVMAQFGDQVNSRWEEMVVDDAFRESVSLSDIYPWSSDTIKVPDVSKLADGKEAHITFTFERSPNIPSIIPDDVQLEEVKAKEVIDADVTAQLDKDRLYFANYEETDVAEDGNRVTCQVEDKEEHFSLEKEALPEWLYDGSLGKKVGDEIDVEGKKLPIVKIEKAVPPSDEEFVEKAKVKSIEELQKRAREHLEKSAEQEAQQQRVQALWEFLLNKYPFELPISLVAAEQKSTVQRMVDELKARRSKEEMIEKEKEIEQMALQQAISNLRVTFLARRICEEAKIKPNDAEVMERTKNLITWQAMMSGQTAPDLTPQQLKPYFGRVHLQMSKERAEEHLLGKV